MMNRLITLLLAGAFLLLLAACDTQEDVLPTAADLAAISTEMAATAHAEETRLAPTPTWTPAITLAPTFTPTVEASPTPTDPADAPTATPPGFSRDGRIFYIYNSDAIAYVTADGQQGTIIETFGVGLPITDLRLSPDGQFLAYAAPGSGTARELYVSSRDGTYRQQISCLGFADVRYPTWSPDGQMLAFFAAPVPGGPYNLFGASLAGSNECPAGNNQRMLAPVESQQIGGLAWHYAGGRLFYSVGPIFMLDFASAQVAQFTIPTGFGPDFALAHSPVRDRLYYFRRQRDMNTGLESGALGTVDTDVVPDEPFSPFATDYRAHALVLSPDGEFLLVGTDEAVLVVNALTSTSRNLVTGLSFAPALAIAPDNDGVAYTALGADSMVPQIWLTRRSGGEPRQLTFNPEGSITDLNWAEG